MSQLQTAPLANNLFTEADLDWLTSDRQISIEDLGKAMAKNYLQACESFLCKDYVNASKLYAKLCKKFSQEKSFVYGYVISELAAGNEDGEKILNDEPVINRNTAHYHYLLGMIMEKDCDYRRAMEEYSNAMEKDEEFLPAIFRLAYLTDLRGSEEQAIELYERCLNTGSDYPNLLLNLGCLYEDIQQYEKALNCYARILARDPENQRAEMFLEDVKATLEMYVDDDKEREHSKLAQILATPISDFELSVRSRNCLNKMKIRTLGDLIEKSEAELLSYKNFGETSLAEIKEILTKKGLKLGMGLEEKNIAKKKEKKEKKLNPLSSNHDLDTSISSLELSVRSRKCLTLLNIKSIGELVQRRETDLLLCKNFGITSLQEIKKKLGEFGLSLSME